LARAASRTVADVLAAWREVNEAVWSESSRRDYASRARSMNDDQISKVAIARLGVDDVERWHAQMRKSGVGDDAIRVGQLAFDFGLIGDPGRKVFSDSSRFIG
jgi:hypothetical protein